MIFESGMKTILMKAAKTHLQGILILVIFTCCISCEKDNEIIKDPVNTFETEYYEMEFVVEPQDRVGFQIFAEETFSNNTAELLSKIGLDEEQIEHILVKEAEISFVETENTVDFGILKYVELTVYTDELGELKVAWLNPVPAEQSTLILELADENIFPYFQESDFILTSQGFLKTRLNKDLRLLVKVKFQVKTRL